MPNTYTVTLSDGTHNVVQSGIPAGSHEEAVRNVLQNAPTDWAIINDAVTLTVTCTQP
ncbi:MAG: hypothetical protein WA765_12360 [Candidatus Acidiferrum sp.]